MIRQAEKEDSKIAAYFASCIFNGSAEELIQEFEQITVSENAAVLLIFDKEKPVGFAQCQLRFDYVEGTKSSPVGYLEGIYIMEEYRRNGYARQLLLSCEKWAKEKGCKEFASDCEIDNECSLKFHLCAGFTEANRIVCFKKNLA